MKALFFTEKEKSVLVEAAIITEEIVGNYFRFSTKEWRKMPYDIKTSAELREEEKTPQEVFAQV